MIIVEDGTGIIGANSFASIETANDYHALRLNDGWADASPAQKGSALVRASDYLSAHYTAPQPPLSASQGLPWPIAGSASVPVVIVAATLMLALYALRGPLASPATRGIKSKTIKAGAVETATVFDDVSPNDAYPEITAMLASVVAQPSSGAKVSFTTVIR